MSFVVRPGRPEDLVSLQAWTQNTFSWGDYVGERYLAWLQKPTSQVLVCADPADVPLALVHVTMVSPSEGWMEGARVHPEHRRSGMGTALNDAGVAWVKERGANVVRLAVETNNPAARNQVAKLGYRVGSTWVAGFSDLDTSLRASPDAQLHPSVSADIDSAWMFWSTSDLSSAGRGMLYEGWAWRTAQPDDLQSAVRDRRLLQSQYGWVMFRAGIPDMQTMWLASAPEDFPGLLNGIVGHTADRRISHLVVKVPAIDWATEALRRAGFSVSEVEVFYRAI